MRKNTLIVSCLTLAAGYFFTGNSNGPGFDYTGAPSSNGTCANCHGGTANLNATLAITVVEQGQFTIVTQYEAGKTYTVGITLTGGSSSKKGFMATVLNSANAKIGTTTNAQGGAAINSANNRSIVGHNTPSNTGFWSFDWTAPSALAGTIKIYATANASNSDNGNTGDQILSKNVTLTASSTSSISNINKAELKVYPNPAKNSLNLPRIVETVSIVNMQGKMVSQFTNTATLDVSGLSPGIYFLQATSKNSTSFAKFIKE